MRACECACERVFLRVFVFARASFRCFCGLGTGVLTHRCWYEDSSIGCGFHEGSFLVTSYMLILSDLTNRNLQSNTIVSVRLFLSCGTRVELVVIRRSRYPLHFHMLAHFLRYLFFFCRRLISKCQNSFTFCYDAFPAICPGFGQGDSSICIPLFWFRHFIFFGICSFSRFLDGRAIPQYREWSSFGNCHVGFPSVCKISFVQCKNMFGNAVFLDFFMPRRCCACCWSGVTRSMQSCRACVCVVSLWCCFMSSVVSSLWLLLVK